MRIVFDIETNGLNPDTVWCVVAKDLDQGTPMHTYGPDSINEAVRLLSQATELIGHNIIGYDLPVLKRLYGFTPNDKQTVVDTLVLSRTIKPDRFQPGYSGKENHSVEAFGCKFGLEKLEHEDWSNYSEEMLERCKRDVELQTRIYTHLLSEISEYEVPEFTLRLEHLVAKVIHQQEVQGVPFDSDRARNYLMYLSGIKQSLGAIVKKQLGYALSNTSSVKDINKRRVAVPLRKSEPSKALLKLWPDAPLDQICGAFVYLEHRLGSRNEIIDKLYQLGWKPKDEEWNTKKDVSGKIVKTNPKLADKGNPVQSLVDMDHKVGKSLGLWYVLAHRASAIEGLLKVVRTDGRISAGANSCGANTARMKHRRVVNIPKANRNDKGELIFDISKQKDIFGSQMRSLFCTLPGKLMVGYDASGLEFRMLAHYLDDPNLTREILDGDIHTVIWGTCRDYVSSRSQMKNITYGLLYGASDPKLGSMADIKPKGWGDKKLGESVRANIMKGLPALDDLTKSVTKLAKNKGYVVAIDGRRLFTRSPHSALNVLLQGGGALVMKVSLAFMYKWTKSMKRVEKVIDMHDEAVYICNPRDSKKVGELGVKSIVQAGKHFKLNCPLDGEYKVGNNWAEVH